MTARNDRLPATGTNKALIAALHQQIATLQQRLADTQQLSELRAQLAQAAHQLNAYHAVAHHHEPDVAPCPAAQSPLAFLMRLPADVAVAGRRGAGETFAENDALSTERTVVTRARLAQRLTDTRHLPASDPRRWVAERLRELTSCWLWLTRADLIKAALAQTEEPLASVYERLQVRTESLYEVIDFFLDRSAHEQDDASAGAGE